MLRYKSLYIILFLFISGFVQSQSDFKNPQEYAKQANKLFEAGEFQKAYPFYQTLRSNDTKNPDYNFRLGVCMMFSETEDKARPIYYFDIALKNNIKDNRIYYYLGRAYHNNYRFAEAKRTYIQYKEKAKEKKVRSFDIERRIQECNNGIALLSHIKLLYVVDKQLVKDATFYKSYDINSSQAKIIAVPDVLKTKYDRKHNSPAFGVFVPDGNMLYFASYGSKGVNGLDIYRVKQAANSGWEKPENLGDQVNTIYDDAYPFITPNGRTLYFSSKGHNSMGGYDVFKSEFSLSSFNWSKVENLNFPINTPFDDIFYVPDTSKNLAYFSSDRQSLSGKIYVYHIGLDKKAEEQDLAKAFREGGDDKDLVRLLKDIADLKTNINVDDYKKEINKQNDTDNIVEEVDNQDKNIIANNNPIKKIDLDDSKNLDKIVSESYNTYKKIAYKVVKLKNQKNNIGKIAAENDKLAKELRNKGDEKSIADARKYEKAAVVSRKIANALKEQISEAENSANNILVESGYLQRYAGLKQKDSVEITYSRILKIKSNVDKQKDVAQEIVSQEMAVVKAKRDAASAKYKESQDALNALNDDKAELKEYQDALSTITDESERQEYIEIINAMKVEVAKKIAKQKALEKEYKSLRDDADATAIALSKVDDVYNEYLAYNNNDKDIISSDEQVVSINQNIDSVKAISNQFVDQKRESLAVNENISNAVNKNEAEQNQENEAEQSSEVVAVNENISNAANKNETEQNQENEAEQSSEVVAVNENNNPPNIEYTTVGSKNNLTNNSQTGKKIGVAAVVISSHSSDNNTNSELASNESANTETVNKANNVETTNLENATNAESNPELASNESANTEPVNKANNVENTDLKNAANAESNPELASNESANTEPVNKANNVETTNLENAANAESNPELTSNESANTETANKANNVEITNLENAANAESNPELTSNESANTETVNKANNVETTNLENAANAESNPELASNENIDTESELQIAKKRKEIAQVYALNQTMIAEKKSYFKSLIDSNKSNVNNLLLVANNEYQISKIQYDSANQLIDNFNRFDIRTQSQIDEISRLKNNAQQHKMNAIAAYQLANKITNDNEYNSELIAKLDNLGDSNNIDGNENIDSLQSELIQINDVVSSIKPKSINNDSLVKNSEIAYNNLSHLISQKQEKENILVSLKENKVQAIEQNASQIEIDSISRSIASITNSIEKLNNQILVAQASYDKSNSLLIAINNSKNTIASGNNNNISEELAVLSNNPNAFVNNTSNEIAELEAKIEPKTNIADNNSQNIVAESIQNTDSIYIPIFRQEKLNELAVKYLEPSIAAIGEIENKEKQINNKQKQTAVVGNEYNKIAKSLLNDISTLKNDLVNTEDTAETATILSNINSKQKQYIAIRRKQIAANLYSELLNQESAELKNISNRIEEEFITNRTKISQADTNNINIAALSNITDYNPETAVNKYIEKLDISSKSKQIKVDVLKSQKSDLEEQYSAQLQKLDKISYEIEQSTKPRKTEKLNAQLKEMVPFADSLFSKIAILDLEIEELSDSLEQNNNIIAALTHHSEYLNSNEIVADNQNITPTESKDLDLSMFNSDSKLTKENLGLAYVEISTKPSMKYYVTNTVDLVYFDENDIPRVKYMFAKKQAQIVQQQIDLLQGINLNSVDDAKQTEIQNKISQLEEIKRLVNTKIIELEDLVASNSIDTNFGEEINENEVINNIQREINDYQSLSNRLLDTAQYFDGYEKQKIIALSKKLKAKSDSVNMVFIELNDIKNKIAYQQNELAISQLELLAPESQITNQAKMQLDEAAQNLSFANNSRTSAENPDLSSDDKQQFINQAIQYEQMALQNQQNAIELLQTQSQSIASVDTVAVNNSSKDSQLAENISADTELNSQNNIESTVTTENITTKPTNNVNSKEIELEELALIDPTKLSGEEKINYEIRKADIIGAFIGNNTSINVDFYSAENPIEIDPELPNGLFYRVQIAAFRKPIPQNTFADVKPVIAETSPTSAFTRYMAGLFLNYNDANIAKNQLRRKGYAGAFVVPYYNGKRISNALAKNIINRGEAYTDSKLVAIADKLKVQNFGSNIQMEQIALSEIPSDTGTQLNDKLQNNENDLIFSVQVGVFGGLRSSARLANASDLFYDITSSGYYRYFSGRYNKEQDAIAARNIIRNKGIKDAFVVAFYKGQKINIRNARQILQTNASSANNVSATNNANTTQSADLNIEQKNIVYKVQIGAFRSARVGNQLAVLENISLNGLDTYTNASGLLIYTSKAYQSYQEAILARDQIRSNGNTDVFVIAFENNVRISTRIARQKLGR